MKSLPVVKKKVVWRVGGPKGAGGRPRNSWEGLGMSVSECPEAWKQIARIDDDTWLLTPKAPRKVGVFLDVHAIAPEQAVELTRIATEEGLLRSEKRWKAMWAIEDEEVDEIVPLEEDYRYSYFEDRRSAETFARSESPDGETWRVAQETVAAPTERLIAIWAKRFSGPLAETAAAPVAWQVILERDRQDLDGFWWNDKFDPDGLSAPRGMIFYSRVANWRWKKDSRPGHELLPNPDELRVRPNDDASIRNLEREWRSTRDRQALERLLVELGRHDRLWATAVTGWHQTVSVRLHDAGAEPRWKGREVLLEISRYDGKNLDLKGMGPRGALRRLLEELRVRYGARSRFLELRDDWERSRPGTPVTGGEWASQARAEAVRKRAEGEVGWNPGWWRAIHTYVSPRERSLTTKEEWVRAIAYGIKRGDEDAIKTAVAAMSPLVPEGAFVIPAPSSRAWSYGGVAKLADEIAKRVRGVYAEPVARSSSVPSSHERRRAGGVGLTLEEHVASMESRMRGACPEGHPVVVVDNVATTGATLEAVRRLLGEGCDVRAVVWAEVASAQVS